MDIDHLAKIQQVEAPPFLLTRIQQRLDRLTQETIPVRLAWTISFFFLLLLATNVMVLTKNHESSLTAADYAKVMHISTNNALYHE